MVVGKGGKEEEERGEQCDIFPSVSLAVWAPDTWSSPGGKSGDLGCSVRMLLLLFARPSWLSAISAAPLKETRYNTHPNPPPCLQKHPYCFSFLPLSWYKRLRQEVKSGMCVQSVESPGDSEVYALLFLLKLCLGPINWDRKRWDRVETLWISCFAMQILGYNTDLLCLLHGHS